MTPIYVGIIIFDTYLTSICRIKTGYDQGFFPTLIYRNKIETVIYMWSLPGPWSKSCLDWVHVISYAIWYHIIWYQIIRKDIISFDVISYDITWYDIISYHVAWCDMVWYEIISHNILSYHITSTTYYVISCHHTIACYTIVCQTLPNMSVST